jgi:excisionase family DNA binding protein
MPTKQTPSDPPNMTVQAAAAYYGVDVKTVRNMIADGRLRAYYLGPRILRLRRSEIEAALTPTDAA